MGNAPGALQAPTLALDAPRLLADVLHVAETHNPEVIASQFAVEEADAEIKLNKGSLLPEVDLVGNSSAQLRAEYHRTRARGSSQVLVQVTMPLYRSGADYSKARAAQQTVTERRG